MLKYYYYLPIFIYVLLFLGEGTLAQGKQSK